MKKLLILFLLSSSGVFAQTGIGTTTPNATALSTFAPIPGGTYTIRVKLPGTQTVVATFALGANLSSGRIVTLAAIGTARGQALGAMALRHF